MLLPVPFGKPGTHFTHSIWAHNPNLTKIQILYSQNKNPTWSQFCTCHDGSAVMSCAKLEPYCIFRNKSKAKTNSSWDLDYKLISRMWDVSHITAHVFTMPFTCGIPSPVPKRGVNHSQVKVNRNICQGPGHILDATVVSSNHKQIVHNATLSSCGKYISTHQSFAANNFEFTDYDAKLHQPGKTGWNDSRVG